MRRSVPCLLHREGTGFGGELQRGQSSKDRVRPKSTVVNISSIRDINNIEKFEQFMTFP